MATSKPLQPTRRTTLLLSALGASHPTPSTSNPHSTSPSPPLSPALSPLHAFPSPGPAPSPLRHAHMHAHADARAVAHAEKQPEQGEEAEASQLEAHSRPYPGKGTAVVTPSVTVPPFVLGQEETSVDRAEKGRAAEAPALTSTTQPRPARRERNKDALRAAAPWYPAGNRLLAWLEEVEKQQQPQEEQQRMRQSPAERRTDGQGGRRAQGSTMLPMGSGAGPVLADPAHTETAGLVPKLRALSPVAAAPLVDRPAQGPQTQQQQEQVWGTRGLSLSPMAEQSTRSQTEQATRGGALPSSVADAVARPSPAYPDAHPRDPTDSSGSCSAPGQAAVSRLAALELSRTSCQLQASRISTLSSSVETSSSSSGWWCGCGLGNSNTLLCSSPNSPFSIVSPAPPSPSSPLFTSYGPFSTLNSHPQTSPLAKSLSRERESNPTAAVPTAVPQSAVHVLPTSKLSAPHRQESLRTKLLRATSNPMAVQEAYAVLPFEEGQSLQLASLSTTPCEVQPMCAVEDKGGSAGGAAESAQLGATYPLFQWGPKAAAEGAAEAAAGGGKRRSTYLTLMLPLQEHPSSASSPSSAPSPSISSCSSTSSSSAEGVQCGAGTPEDRGRAGNRLPTMVEPFVGKASAETEQSPSVSTPRSARGSLVSVLSSAASWQAHQRQLCRARTPPVRPGLCGVRSPVYASSDGVGSVSGESMSDGGSVCSVEEDLGLPLEEDIPVANWEEVELLCEKMEFRAVKLESLDIVCFDVGGLEIPHPMGPECDPHLCDTGSAKEANRGHGEGPVLYALAFQGVREKAGPSYPWIRTCYCSLEARR